MWGEEARLWGMPWSMHCPGQEWVEQRQAQKIKGAGVMTAATSLTISFPVPIRPGPLLPGVQVDLPGRLWRDRWVPASWLLIWVAGTHQAPLDKGTEANLPRILPGVI